MALFNTHLTPLRRSAGENREQLVSNRNAGEMHPESTVGRSMIFRDFQPIKVFIAVPGCYQTGLFCATFMKRPFANNVLFINKQVVHITGSKAIFVVVLNDVFAVGSVANDT